MASSPWRFSTLALITAPESNEIIPSWPSSATRVRTPDFRLTSIVCSKSTTLISLSDPLKRVLASVLLRANPALALRASSIPTRAMTSRM